MSKINYLDICQSALDKYGVDNQLRQLQEECAELIHAVNKYIRNDKRDPKDLIDEASDVAIMLIQFEIIFGEDKNYASMVKKLKRLQARLNK